MTTYDYNNAGELALTNYSDTTPDVTHTYNRRGLKDHIVDASGERYMMYNVAGMYGGETIFSDIISSYLDITAQYDSFLRLSNKTIEDFDSGFFKSLNYGYDNASRTKYITDPTMAAGQQYVYEYEPNSSLVKSLTYSNEYGAGVMKTSREHDKLNRVTSLVTNRLSDNAELAGFHYSYNSLNQRETMRTQDNSYWDYGYDPLGQVTSGEKKLASGQQIDGYDYGYTFDGIGNRVTADVNGKVQQYTANNLNQYQQRTVPGDLDVVGETDPVATVDVNSVQASRQGKYFHKEVAVTNTVQPQYPNITVTAQTGSITTVIEDKNVYVPKTPELFTYDWDGNLLADGQWNYTWDGENRLIGLESVTTAPASAKKKIAYQYDYMGRRISKTVREWDGQASTWLTGATRAFIYDGWNLICEVGAGGGQYIWGLDNSGSLQGAGGVGGLLSTTVGSAPAFAIADANGNVAKLVSELQTMVVGEYEYGPFGELLHMTGQAAEANPFRFSSKYQEPESGLLYYGYRYFNAVVGLWLNRDPIEEIGGVNLYCSVRNDTVNNVDVLGLYELLNITEVDKQVLRHDLWYGNHRIDPSRVILGPIQGPPLTIDTIKWEPIFPHDIIRPQTSA